jgi:hypothetical protein
LTSSAAIACTRSRAARLIGPRLHGQHSVRPATGYRFSNAAGAHEAVVDYALAIKLVDRRQYAQLDQLRGLRHQVNYPEDLIAPSPREVEQYSDLVDTILALAEKKLPTRRIPPPPK